MCTKNQGTLCRFAAFLVFCGIIVYLHQIDKLITYTTITNAVSNVNTTVISTNKSNQTYEKLKLLIGLGCTKCASGFMQDKMFATMELLTTNNLNVKFVPKYGELHYWHDKKCRFKNNNFKNSIDINGCNLNEYILKFFSKHGKPSKRYFNYSDYYKAHKNFDQIILTEKTPRYNRLYFVAYRLSYYAHLYKNTYLYVLLRNPIRRLWSGYWMGAKHLDNTDHHNIHLIHDKIQNDINEFPVKYPLFNNLLSMMRIENKSITNNNDINEENIVNLYIAATDDIYEKNEKIPSLIKGCYYIPLVVWHHMFTRMVVNDFKFNDNLKLKNRFQVIQTEYLFKDLQNSIKQLLCWLLDYDMKKCSVLNDLLSMDVITQLLGNKERSGGFAPKSSTVDIMDLPAAKPLQRIYSHCNKRLYWFLDKHQLILQNTSFNQWD